MVTRLHLTAQLLALTSLCALAPAMTSCTEASDDVFHVYVVNGYAGQGRLSIYSTNGPLATGLTYGETTGKLTIDRNRFDGTLQIFTEGAPELATVALDAYAFYPNETVTLFLTRRSGRNDYNLRVLRHHLLGQNIAGGQQIPTPFNCAVQVYNGLSLSNTYTPNSFDMQLQFQLNASGGAFTPFNPRFDDVSWLYNLQAEATVPTPCGDLNLSTLSQSGILSQENTTAITQLNSIRAGQHTIIQNDPWFYLVRGVELGAPDALAFRWGLWRAASGGDVIEGIRSTAEYRECVTAAVQAPVQPDSNGRVICPGNWVESVTVDAVALSECVRLVPYAGEILRPDSETGAFYYYNTNSTAGCRNNVRIRTRNFETVFDVPIGQRPNGPKQFTIEVPLFTWAYYIIFGTPISPSVYRLNPQIDIDNNIQNKTESYGTISVTDPFENTNDRASTPGTTPPPTMQ